MSWNENRRGEIPGDRDVVQVYECYSKSKGEKMVKYKKGPVNEKWKAKLVEDPIERKRIKGPGNPLNNEEYDDGVVDVVATSSRNSCVSKISMSYSIKSIDYMLNVDYKMPYYKATCLKANS